MKYHGYKILYAILRSLVYVKRGLVWIWTILRIFISKTGALYTNTLGFRVYKAFFFLKKKLQKYKIPLDSRIIELIGKRGTLQVVLFLILIALMYPHSTLYTQDSTSIPGRKTLLYRIVGPGTQDFEGDTIIVEEARFEQKRQLEEEAWKQGSLAVGNPSSIGKEIAPEPQDLSGTSPDGTAITKPTIISGTDIGTNTPSSNGAVKRDKTITYTVQPGDVIGSIAQRHGISVNTILWANNLSARSYIRPGDTLVILPEDGVTHKVIKGETVGKIAGLYGAKAEDIVRANRLKKDGADIVIGEELFIPGGERKAAPVIVPRPAQRRFASNPISQVSAPPPSIAAPAGSGYIWPTSVRRITQYFGLRHTGVDIAGPTGSPLYAAKSGKVIKSQCGWNGGYGCYIIVDHGGVQTLYAHASKLYVSVGDEVTQGQTIALMGSTGRSTGPHIHFEVRSGGRRLNPLQYVK